MISQVKKQFVLSLVFLALGISSCEPSRSLFVERNDLREHYSELIAITLDKGDTVIFDNDLGWYDIEKGEIDGRSIDGKNILVQVDQVKGGFIQPRSTVDPVGVFVFLFPIVVGILVVAKLCGYGK